MDKEIFVTPEIEVIRFSEEDIVTTSGIGDGIILPDEEWEWQ